MMYCKVVVKMKDGDDRVWCERHPERFNCVEYQIGFVLITDVNRKTVSIPASDIGLIVSEFLEG